MKYIIDTGLVFDSDERTLFLQESPDESLEIGAITARLFVEMLENVAGLSVTICWMRCGPIMV